jgi:PqqD family protein of HPr-rel-A system
LLWVHFDDGAAVYHRPSGKTHFLNLPAVRLLERLCAGAMATHDAIATIGNGAGRASASEDALEVAQILAHLEHLGLIRRTAT